MARRSHATAQLRREVGTRFPLRDTGSDGWIGDAAHRARPSDHNPDSRGVVHAEDFDEDNRRGDESVGRALWDFLLKARDPRTKYVIYERRMVSSYPVRGYPAWTPRPYTGSNGHLTHLHISVYGDDGSPWGFATEEDDVELVKTIQRALGVKDDGVLGPVTEGALTEAMRAARLLAPQASFLAGTAVELKQRDARASSLGHVLDWHRESRAAWPDSVKPGP